MMCAGEERQGKTPPEQKSPSGKRGLLIPAACCALQHLSPMGQTAMQLKQVYWNPMKDAW